MIELYVYYPVAPADAAAVLAIAGNWPAVQWLKRSDDSSPLQTWMEIHRGAGAEASEQALATLLAPYIAGARQVERFMPVLPASATAP